MRYIYTAMRPNVLIKFFKDSEGEIFRKFPIVTIGNFLYIYVYKYFIIYMCTITILTYILIL